MKTYSIPIIWAMSAHVEIQAESLEQALIEAENAPLPSDGNYLEGSFEIDYPVIPYLNKELTDQEKKDCNIVSF